MANVAVFSSGVTYTETGDLSAAGKWVSGEEDAVKIGGYHYEYERVPAPGVTGQGTIAFGYRSQRIELKVVYVDTSENNVVSAWNADINAIGATINATLVLLGGTYYGIQLDPSASFMSRVRPVGLASATYFARATVVIDSLRLT